MTAAELKAYVRDVPDFPSPGILFRDLTPLLAAPEALRASIDLLEAWARPRRPDVIAGVESRGFLFGAPLAVRLGVGVVPVRKPGKLPWQTLSESYTLEYGRGELQMHADALRPGARVLVVDDLLATGGTAAATTRLVRRAGGEPVGAVFLVELTALGGRSLLDGIDVHALMSY
ncbi:MAG: adenine phosphoribosyltransferase [Acidobacteria bacterium]|jgi:adenine phosphoribosyltransferase|nr:adenine phosphoribosyltransferase [Acidobacteriota bacterium]MCU0253098.1 adenine phosphoribosyltransferase [Acidobacteriota bacterium]